MRFLLFSSDPGLLFLSCVFYSTIFFGLPLTGSVVSQGFSIFCVFSVFCYLLYSVNLNFACPSNFFFFISSLFFFFFFSFLCPRGKLGLVIGVLVVLLWWVSQ